MEYKNVLDDIKDNQSKMHLLDEKIISLENEIERDIRKKLGSVIVILDTCDEKFDCQLSDFIWKIYIHYDSIKITINRVDECGGLFLLGLEQLCKVNELFDCKVEFDMDESHIVFMLYPYEN